MARISPAVVRGGNAALRSLSTQPPGAARAPTARGHRVPGRFGRPARAAHPGLSGPAAAGQSCTGLRISRLLAPGRMGLRSGLVRSSAASFLVPGRGRSARWGGLCHRHPSLSALAQPARLRQPGTRRSDQYKDKSRPSKPK